MEPQREERGLGRHILPAVVVQLAAKGLLQESRDARIVDLSADGLGICLIQKADDSSLYVTRDLAAAMYRHATYGFTKALYVVGEGDSDASALAKYGELDKGCEADAEGPASASFRLQRGLTYFHYATDVLGATHRLAVVPLVVNGSPCGHDQACFFASTVAQTEVFGP